jgi:type I restriction enzyme S subunit
MREGMSKDKLIPDLRFPEFVNEGEWVENRVGEVYEFKITNSFSREYLNYMKGHVKNIHYGDIHTKFNTLFDITKERVPFINQDVSIEKIKEENYCIEGDIIFADASEDLNDVGKSIELINLNNEKLVSGLHTLLARQREAKLSVGFGGYLFKAVWIRKQIQKEAQGAKVLGISASRISNVKISYPKKTQEQQKIASCLSSLDDLIAAHSQKLELLKDHKKGLMQNLFPQEGEKVPKVRFKEFENDGEWRQKKLENFIDLFTGIPLKSEELTDDRSGIPILRGINITEGYIRHSKDIDKYFLGDLENLDKLLVQENDIVIAMDGSKVGKNVALISKEDERSILIQRVARIRPTNEVNIRFIYQYFISDIFRSYVDTVNTSSGIPHISAQQIKDFEVGLPPNIQEQQKIASCLSSLDSIITAQTEKIEQLKLHKKGLMQGLFPRIQD